MKAMKWLTKLIVTALITSFVCVVCTFWVINTYVDMILEQYQLKSAVSGAPDWSKFTARLGRQLAGFRLFGGEAPPPQEARSVFSAEAAADGKSGDINSTNRTGSETPAGQPAKPGPGTDSSNKPTPPDDAVAVFGHQSGSAAGSAGGQSGGSSLGAGTGSGADGKIVVSGEEFTRKKDLLSSVERNKIFNLLVVRVPQTEMQSISQKMEDGITASELKEIESTLQKYLKPEEYSQLLSMIKQGP